MISPTTRLTDGKVFLHDDELNKGKVAPEQRERDEPNKGYWVCPLALKKCNQSRAEAAAASPFPAKGQARKRAVVIAYERFLKGMNPLPEGVNFGWPKAQGDKTANAMDGKHWIQTLEGAHVVIDGDYIITGVKGERYPCKPDIFEMTYDAVQPLQAPELGTDNWPRRNQMLAWTPAERAIHEAMQVVEAAGAHPRLTDAVMLLAKAQEAVADFVETLPAGDPGRTPGAGANPHLTNEYRDRITKFAGTNHTPPDDVAATQADQSGEAKSSNLIPPTVGRVVHYTPTIHQMLDASRMKGQPYSAHITHVWGPELVNVSVDQDGSFLLNSAGLKPTSVPFSATPNVPGTWTWMDYQKGQAAKTDTVTPILKDLVEVVRLLQSGADSDHKAILRLNEFATKRIDQLTTRQAQLDEAIAKTLTQVEQLTSELHNARMDHKALEERLMPPAAMAMPKCGGCGAAMGSSHSAGCPQKPTEKPD